ncbi:hypothetical protein RND81_09G219900 [Saponaria officinalis]|uniref:Peptidase A1 domain-containing protein n=1 Tax=Saponaria officinalis TaxID=3572 RepID=A0AAW1IQV0_SAPOF
MSLCTLLHLILHIIFIFHQANAFSMNIHPIDSPHLQILPKSFTIKERHHFLRNISLSRAFYANKKNAKLLGLNSIHSSLSNVQRSYFVTQLSFGSQEPPFNPLVILDTSADQTWIQCAGCNPCFDLQKSFLVENSTSYSRLGVDDGRCIPKINYEGGCGFEASYGKGHTQGYLGTDIFNFNDSSGYFPNIAFGCAVKNHDFDFGGGAQNVIAGVHGLGVGPQSMLTQLEMDIKGRFSYCLRPDNGSSTIKFGDDVQISGDFATIAMNPEARYHLYLAGITVQGRRLTIDPKLFQLDQDYTRGFFIDPSATFTVLTNTAYVALKNAIIEHFKKYGMNPSAPSKNIFDLCYDKLPGLLTNYPSITFNFIKSPGGDTGEIELKLNQENVFGNFAVANGFCLQMLSTPDSKDGPSIFGAFQQTNFQFAFDVKTRLLSFAPKSCKDLKV